MQCRHAKCAAVSSLYTGGIHFVQHLLNALLAGSVSLNLTLANLPQFVDSWSLSGDNTLSHLCSSSESILPHNGVGGSQGLDSDNTDSWILWSTIVLSVTKISKPCLERRGVVLLHE